MSPSDLHRSPPPRGPRKTLFWALTTRGLVSGKHRASAGQKNLQKEAEERERMTLACVASRPEEEAAGSVPSSLEVAGEQSDPRLSALQATQNPRGPQAYGSGPLSRSEELPGHGHGGPTEGPKPP